MSARGSEPGLGVPGGVVAFNKPPLCCKRGFRYNTGYPTAVEPTHSPEPAPEGTPTMPADPPHFIPGSDFETRRQEHLNYCAAHATGRRTGFFSQIARLELGLDVDEAPFHEAFAVIDARLDCSDFSIGGMLRNLVAAIEARVLGFKYWWDEAHGDNRRRDWTENHQIIFRAEFGARSDTIRHRDLAHVIDLTTTELAS